ncbi:MAG: hypothetical protein ACRC1J_04715, partial [Sandaracinobacteroides sp.]
MASLAETFDVGKVAMPRTYVDHHNEDHHNEPVAIPIWRNGRMVRCYRGATMPWPSVGVGDRATRQQLGAMSASTDSQITAPTEVEPLHRIDDRSARLVLEQTERLMQLLHLEPRGEDE